MLLKILLLGVLLVVVLYREKVLSTVSELSLGATVDVYSTLSCNIDKEKELQCLVQMEKHMPKKRLCNITHGLEKYAFCGAITH